jgi:NAD-dependent SIR2 family protein deacetylase
MQLSEGCKAVQDELIYVCACCRYFQHLAVGNTAVGTPAILEICERCAQLQFADIDSSIDSVHSLPMRIESNIPIVSADDFARRFSMRASGLMWLLGAGTSAAAGIPTASDMIWEFKQQLYVSQRRVSPKSVADLANPAVRNALQSFIEGLNRYPQTGAPDEYAELFEAAYPSEQDRRTYIEAKISGAKPSYGHIALATLMKADRARVVWTTNFDPLVADACAKVYDGTGHLTTSALDAPELAKQALIGERWPTEIKLHGDFRSRRLKNTSDELRQQDASLRDLFVNACGRSGLIVTGYSGRDDSIMNALDTALDSANPFPSGLFWLHRGEGSPLPSVTQLLLKATAKGVDAGLVSIENFDETLRDLIRLLTGIDTVVLDTFAANRNVWTAAPKPQGQKGFPVIRLNGIELKSTPSVCRRVNCTIGGFADVAAAIKNANVPILATRTRAGILAFGSDADVRKAFSPYTVTEFDLHTIELRRLRYESQERGLLRQALSKALVRAHDLILHRKRNSDLLAPIDIEDQRWKPLKKLVGSLSGSISNHPELRWQEGISTRLDWAEDKLWLLFEPRTVFIGITDQNWTAATDFARERTVRRYNKALNELIAFWSDILAANGADLYALNSPTGVDAAFKLGTETAYSRRLQG